MSTRRTAALGIVVAAAVATSGVTAVQATSPAPATSTSTSGIDQGAGPRLRVITDNDYSGDPDGLVQLAQLALSPSVDIRAVVGSHLAPGDGFDSSDQTATNAAAKANELLALAGRSDLTAVAGSNTTLTNRHTPDQSAGAQAIIDEAMRTDTDEPLFVLVGGGLTDLASAYLEQPKIASRLTAIWIGGPEYAGQATPPPGASGVEYNTNIDINAARVVFDSPIKLWQVPRNAYRQALAGFPEMQARLKGTDVGDYLYSALDGIRTLAASVGLNIGETYIVGDSPLVLLSALQSSFEADPSSSAYETVRAPRFDAQGQYVKNPKGRKIRVYTRLDTRLMMEDLYAKVSLAG